MHGTILALARKPLSQPVSRSTPRTRCSLLARLRDEIAILRTIRFDHASIGKTLRISPEDACALSPKTNKPDRARRLKRHAINALLNGRHAAVGGKSLPTRAKNLLKIASTYSLDELLEEPGVGAVTAVEIQLWLEERGASLRPSD